MRISPMKEEIIMKELLDTSKENTDLKNRRELKNDGNID